MIDWLLRAARLLAYAGVLGLFGVAWFSCAGETDRSAAQGERAARRVRGLLLAAACAGFAATAAWLPLESISLTRSWTAWPALIAHTRFGRITAARAALLAAAAACLWIRNSRGRRAAVASLAAICLASFAWTGHGAEGAGVGRWAHLGFDSLHLFAAALWIGALVSLTTQALLCRPDELEGARILSRRLDGFSRVGATIVAALAATGIANVVFVLGPPHAWPTLLGSSYGSVLLAKLAVFVLMLPLAVLNRLRLAPALRAAVVTADTALPRAAALQMLRRSLLTESLLALFVLVAVAILGTLAPPASG